MVDPFQTILFTFFASWENHVAIKNKIREGKKNKPYRETQDKPILRFQAFLF